MLFFNFLSNMTGRRQETSLLLLHHFPSVISVFAALLLLSSSSNLESPSCVAAISVNSSGSSEEVSALLAFKAAVTDPLGVLSSWNSSSESNPCNWYGITCDNTLHVNKILIEDAELSGPISPQLANLTHLRYLVLSQNQFSGFVPPELSQIGE